MWIGYRDDLENSFGGCTCAGLGREEIGGGESSEETLPWPWDEWQGPEQNSYGWSIMAIMAGNGHSSDILIHERDFCFLFVEWSPF